MKRSEKSDAAAVLREYLTHPASVVYVFDWRNHLFQPPETGAMTVYINTPVTFDESALAFIADWMVGVAGAAAQEHPD